MAETVQAGESGDGGSWPPCSDGVGSACSQRAAGRESCSAAGAGEEEGAGDGLVINPHPCSLGDYRVGAKVIISVRERCAGSEGRMRGGESGAMERGDEEEDEEDEG